MALLTMQSALSSSMDAFTLKTSKMLVSSFVPVVGSALSEAISTASGCLKLVKSAVGIYGIGAAVCTFLPLLLRTASWYLVLSIGAAAGEMLSVREAPGTAPARCSVRGVADGDPSGSTGLVYAFDTGFHHLADDDRGRNLAAFVPSQQRVPWLCGFVDG